jgi:hypothetical protein
VSDMGVTGWPEEAPKLPGNVREMNAHRGKPVALIGKEADLQTPPASGSQCHPLIG